MDVAELLSFQPDKPGSTTQSGKRKYEDVGYDDEPAVLRGRRGGLTLSENDKDNILANEDSEMAVMNDTSLKKMILQFEKKVYKNQEMRIKYPDLPGKFMESEVELNDVVQEMHVIATVPDLYHIMVDLNAVQSLLQLLNHDNTDISIAVVDLLQEMTDVDTLTESEEGANMLLDSLMEGQVVGLLVQNLDRLDETIKEESDGVHNTLSIVENMTELRPEICQETAQQGLMQWILKRLKAKLPFDSNKLYCSEILSILLQSTEENRQMLGEMDGIDVVLQQLAVYKRHDPSSSEEIEFMENLFSSLCSSLMTAANREKFLKGEGLQLMNLMLKEKKMSRGSALKVLNHAVTGPEGADNCQKFVDILGLRSIFPLFMKTPKEGRKTGPARQELEEHILSVMAATVRNCSGTQKQRLFNKFTENDHEKVDRLMELHFKYLDKVRHVDEKIAKQKNEIRYKGGDIDEDQEEDYYMQRLEAGLFTLQMTDYIMLEISQSGPAGIKQRVMQILNLRGGSIKTIKGIMREYAGNIGDAMETEAREAEQAKLLQLVDKF